MAETSAVPFSLIATRKGRWMGLFLLMIFCGALGLDQISKTEVQQKLLIDDFSKQDIRLFRGGRHTIGSIGEKFPKDGTTPFYFGLKFQYSRNPGAAFSMLADLEDKFRVPFFYGVTAVAVAMILYLLRSLPFSQHLTRIGLAFIGAGAVGNFLDRLHYGYVVDFISVDWNLFGWSHDFAIFNVADMCINVGIYLYIADFIISWRRSKKAPKAPDGDLHPVAESNK